LAASGERAAERGHAGDRQRKEPFPMNPTDFTKGMIRFIDDFGVNIVGGCCGTMPSI